MVKIYNLHKAENKIDLYVIFEIMETDLHTVIRAEVCRDVQIRFITWQMLMSLKFVHSANVTHRDMKPSNILINKSCKIKLADFGLARWMKDIDKYVDPVLTDYIATRWYRPPECLLTDGYYNHKMDYWGIGCVFFEVLTLTPLFPGTNELDQVHKIHNILGTPQKELLDQF